MQIGISWMEPNVNSLVEEGGGECQVNEANLGIFIVMFSSVFVAVRDIWMLLIWPACQKGSAPLSWTINSILVTLKWNIYLHLGGTLQNKIQSRNRCEKLLGNCEVNAA
jgi:hypothetical protein